MASRGRENSRVTTGTLLIQTALCWGGMGSRGFLCCTACLHRWCLRDAGGSDDQPATVSVQGRAGSAAGAAPVVSRMTLPDA